MKTLFFCISVFCSASMAQSFSQLRQCLAGINSEAAGDKGSYSTVLAPESDELKGSLVVLTDQGAQLVQGEYSGPEGGMTFVFSPDGQSRIFEQTYYYKANAEGDFGWTGAGTKATLSPFRKVTSEEALKIAGRGALKQAQLRSKFSEFEVKELEKIVKLSVGTGEDRNQKNSRENFLTKLNLKEVELQKKLSDLKSCKNFSDSKLLQAAELERDRLQKILQAVLEMKNPTKKTSPPTPSAEASKAAK